MTSPAAAPDRYIGREILNGQFKILKKIGTGGMGAVYQALQPEMNRMVAVKILHSKLKARKDLVSRFRREARAMSHLSHPNTVKVMMYGELEQGELYIVMEFLEGRNLNQIVRKTGPMPVERAIPVLIQVCGALQEAHELGIIHRDLKPENIFLTNSAGLTDFAKVLDFGLAKVTERELRPGSIMLTQEGMVFGTPEFMSPEQAQGRVLDARSDIYSLAIILYEGLTGKLPFDAKTSMEHIQMHVMKQPIPLDERVPGKTFPPGLGAVIARALAKDPAARYASATEFADALRPFAPATPAQLASAAARAAAPHGPPPSAVEANAVAPAAPPSQGGARALPPTAAMAAVPAAPGSYPQGQPPAVRSATATVPMAAVAPRKPASGTKLLLVAIVSVIVGVLATILVLKLIK
ncbi:MAG: serine/threonine protein kinase [Myxococcales bacterium]|nr:serine/threonine protein kinase [Myxococcales bacterium]